MIRSWESGSTLSSIIMLNNKMENRYKDIISFPDRVNSPKLSSKIHLAHSIFKKLLLMPPCKNQGRNNRDRNLRYKGLPS